MSVGVKKRRKSIYIQFKYIGKDRLTLAENASSIGGKRTLVLGVAS